MSSNVINVVKFLGPHLLSMIKDAVNKWNDEVPVSLSLMYEQDVQLISTKLSKLPGYGVTLEGKAISDAVKECEIQPYTCEKINAVLFAVRKMFEGFYLNMSTQVVEAICEKRQGGLYDLFQKTDALVAHFRISFGIHDLGGLSNVKISQEVRVIDDALLAMARIMPNRQIAPCGTLILRDVESIFYPDVSDVDFLKMNSQLSRVYDVQRYKSMLGYSGVRLVPHHSFITDEALNSIYNLDLSTTTVGEIMDQCNRSDLEWFILKDTNISPDAIINKLLGASVSSLSNVIVDLLLYMALCLNNARAYSPDSIQKKIREGPWLSISDTMLFVSPTDLYHTIGTDTRIKSNLLKDFEVMTELLELYRCHVSHYGNEIFQSQDPDQVRPTRIKSSHHEYPSLPPMPAPSAPSLSLPDVSCVLNGIDALEEKGWHDRANQLREILKLYQ